MNARLRVAVAAVCDVTLGLTVPNLGTDPVEAIPALHVYPTPLLPTEVSALLDDGCEVPARWPSGEVPASLIVRDDGIASRVSLADAYAAGTLSVLAMCGDPA